MTQAKTGRGVFIAIPSYSWCVSLPTMRSLFADCNALMARGDTVQIYDEACGTEISQARNQIIDVFLHSDATDLVFVDDDVCWQRGGLVRLLDAPVDFVAGVYRRRVNEETYPLKWLDDRADLIADEKTGLLEVEAVPGGFVRISRRALVAMNEHYKGELTQQTPLAIDGKWTALCEPLWRGNRRFGEDFALCMRWRDIGGSVWIVPEMTMGHMGPSSFNGNVGNWLRSRNGND